jgi:hypothetical protein
MSLNFIGEPKKIMKAPVFSAGIRTGYFLKTKEEF